MAAEGSSGGGGGGRKTPLLHKPRERGAAKFLTGLPSRGNFSSSSISYNLGGLRVYVCEHDTDPPEGQVIETDTTNILIRHLQLKKKESEAKDAGSRTQGESGKGKRCAARSLGVQKSSKKPNLGSSSGLPSSDEAISGFSQHTLQSFTVERLRGLLRQRGLTTKGKKESKESYDPRLCGEVTQLVQQKYPCTVPAVLALPQDELITRLREAQS